MQLAFEKGDEARTEQQRRRRRHRPASLTWASRATVVSRSVSYSLHISVLVHSGSRVACTSTFDFHYSPSNALVSNTAAAISRVLSAPAVPPCHWFLCPQLHFAGISPFSSVLVQFLIPQLSLLRDGSETRRSTEQSLPVWLSRGFGSCPAPFRGP